MGKTSPRPEGPPSIPEWAKLPQYKEQAAKFYVVKDVEMEGMEEALEQKLVLRRSLRRKRSDYMFDTAGQSTAKRVKVPEPRSVRFEQQPEFHHTPSIPLQNENTNDTSPPDTDSQMTTDPPPTPSPPHLKNLKNDPLLPHYHTWLTTQHIPTHQRPRWAPPSETQEPTYTPSTTLDTEHLASCYILGERLNDTLYKTAILRVIQKHAVEDRLYPSDRAVAIIYEGTGKGSPARRMMVDFWAYAGTERWVEEGDVGMSVCGEFVEELVQALLRVRGQVGEEKWPWAEGVDAYLVS